MAFGLGSDGFTKKRLLEIRQSIIDGLTEIFGVIRTDGESVFGNLIGPFSKEAADIWEAVETLYNSYTTSATDIALDHVLQLVGLQRRAASATRVIACCYGDQGTVIAADKKAQLQNTELLFSLDSPVTIDIADTLQCTVEVTSDGDAAYTIKVNGTDFTDTSGTTVQEIAENLVNAINDSSTGSDAMVAYDNEDGTFKLTSIDNETGYPIVIVAGSLDVTEFGSPGTFDADSTGPTAVPGPVQTTTTYTPGALNIIATPVSGWDRVENLQDGVIGADVESDTAARARRANSLQTLGNATVDAIYAAILNDVAGVTQCSVFENDQDVDDVAGRPPHSFEAVVLGGDDQDVIDKIWEVKPAGIRAYGNTSGSATDSQGFTHTIEFSRPVDKLVYMRVTLTKYDEEEYPVDGNSQIIDNLVEFGTNNQPLGKDLILQRYYEPIYDVSGISEATIEWAIVNEGDPAPAYPGDYSSANIEIDAAEIAIFSSSRITIA